MRQIQLMICALGLLSLASAQANIDCATRAQSPLDVRDIVLVVVPSSSSLDSAADGQARLNYDDVQLLAEHRKWLARGVTVVSAVRASSSGPNAAADASANASASLTAAGPGRWLEVDLGGSSSATAGDGPVAASSAVAAALAPGRAAAALSAAGLQSWRWLFLIPADTLANLDALRALLDGWDDSLPAAVSDCLVPTPTTAGSSSSIGGSNGGSSSSTSGGGKEAGAGARAGAGEGGAGAGACLPAPPVRAGGRACHGRPTPPAVLSAAGGVALSRGLLDPCPADASSSSTGNSSSSGGGGSGSSSSHRRAAQLLRGGGGSANATSGGGGGGGSPLAALAAYLSASEPLADGSGFDVLSRLLYYAGMAITSPHPHAGAAGASAGLLLARHRFGGQSAAYTFRSLDQAAALCGGAAAAAVAAAGGAGAAVAGGAGAPIAGPATGPAPAWCSHLLWGVVSTPIATAAGPLQGRVGGGGAAAAAAAGTADPASGGGGAAAGQLYESLWAALNATAAAAATTAATAATAATATSGGTAAALQSQPQPQPQPRYYYGLQCLSPLPSCAAMPAACVAGGAGPEPPCAMWRSGRFDWAAPEPHYEWENFLDWRGAHNPHRFGWRVPLSGFHRPGDAPPDLPACQDLDVPGFWGRGRWIAHVPPQQRAPAAAAAAGAAGAVAAGTVAAPPVRLTAADVPSDQLRPDAENSTCGFHRLSRAGLRECFAGKRVYFVGDSLARQMYSRLVSHLRGIEASVEHYFHAHSRYRIFANGTDLYEIGVSDTAEAAEAAAAAAAAQAAAAAAAAGAQGQGRRALRGRMGGQQHQQEKETLGRRQQQTAAGGQGSGGGQAASGGGGESSRELLRLGFFWLESVARWEEVLPALAPDVFVFGGMRWHDDPRGPDAALAAATAVVARAAAAAAASNGGGGRGRLVVWAPFGYGTKADNLTAAWAARLRRWAADMTAAHPPPAGGGGVRVQVLPADVMSRTAPFLRDYGEDKATHWGCEFQLAWPGAIASAKTPADGDCTDPFDFNSLQMIASTYCAGGGGGRGATGGGG